MKFSKQTANKSDEFSCKSFVSMLVQLSKLIPTFCYVVGLFVVANLLLNGIKPCYELHVKFSHNINIKRLSNSHWHHHSSIFLFFTENIRNRLGRGRNFRNVIKSLDGMLGHTASKNRIRKRQIFLTINGKRWVWARRFCYRQWFIFDWK